MTGSSMHTESVCAVLLVVCAIGATGLEGRVFDMDRLATCGQDITVFEKDVILNGRSNAAPANPPLECTVYLTSGYTEADGNYRLQIAIEAIDIQDCQVHVDIFNGRGAYGSFLRSLGCNSMTTDILYTQEREATVRFSRPSILYQTAYTFTFRIKTYRDNDEGGYVPGTNRLSPGVIIGIILAVVALIVVAILLLWCYRTGRIGNYYGGGVGEEDDQYATSKTSLGEDNGTYLEKSESMGSAIDHRDPKVWASVTNGQYNPAQPTKLGRAFQKRNEVSRYGEDYGRQLGQNGYGQGGQRGGSGLDVNGQRYSAYNDDSYEPYEREQNVDLTMTKHANTAEWKKDEGEFVRNGSKRASTGSRGGGKGEGEIEGEGTGTFKRDNGTRGSRGSRGKGQGEIEGEGAGTFKRDNGTRGSRGSRGSTSSKRAYADRKGGNGGQGDDDDTELARRHEDGNEDASGEFTRGNTGGAKLRSSDRDSKRGSKRNRQTDAPGGNEGNTMAVPEATVNSPSDPKGGLNRDKQFFPENASNIGSNDLQGEADSETMSNPVHVNAAVRASIPGSKASPRSKKRKKKNGRNDETPGAALPPEAQEPVFTTAGSETPYDTSASLPYTSYGVPSYEGMYPNQYGAPYGLMPMGGFAPAPGQTYAYYQMGPIPGAGPVGMPNEQQQVMMSGQPMMAGQAAWCVQDTPQGPVKKGFMVTTAKSPSKKHRHPQDIPGNMGHPGAPDYTSTPADALTPRRGRKMKQMDPADAMDISTIAAGGPPPEPGAGQRSAVVRKGVDPNTGMQVNQVVWRDTIVDPSDPTPDDNPQITRKTLTRITTRSGHGDLPTDQNPRPYNDYSDRLGIESDAPGFLSPSAPALPPPVSTPDVNNVDFYLGQGHHPGAPEAVIHDRGNRSNAFLDSVTIQDSAA